MHHYKISENNDILDRIHQVVSSILKTKDPSNVTFDAVAPWRNIIAYIVYALQWSYHSTLKATPGLLVFGHDLLLDINLQPDYT